MTTAEAPILELKNIHVVHKTRSGSLFKPGTVHAVNDVSIDVRRGTTIGIVGESGCGKSTLAKVMVGLQKPTSGDVVFRGRSALTRSAGVRKEFGRAISIVFQDPATALNPRMTVADILTDPLDVHGIGNRASRTARVRELVGLVGLPNLRSKSSRARSPAVSGNVSRSRVHSRSNLTSSWPTSRRRRSTSRCERRS